MQNVTGPTLISAVTPKALVWPREPQLLISQFSIFWFDTSCKQHGERMKLTIFEGQTLNICIHDYMNININKMYIYINLICISLYIECTNGEISSTLITPGYLNFEPSRCLLGKSQSQTVQHGVACSSPWGGGAPGYIWGEAVTMV